MPPALVRVLGCTGLAAMLVLLGLWLGHGLATTQATAEKARAAERAAEQLLQVQAEGEAAVAGVQEQLRLQKSYQSNLAERQRHAPLTASVVRPHAACAPGAGVLPAAGAAGRAAADPLLAGGRDAGVRLAGDPGDGERAGGSDGMAAGTRAAHPGLGPQPTRATSGETPSLASHPDELQLSLAAVSLWNSALSGRDVPAGACSPAGAAEPACAAAAGLTLDDAWANQRTNAASCAADRARYQALINLLHQRAQR